MNTHTPRAQDDICDPASGGVATTGDATPRPPMIARALVWPLLAIVLVHTLIIGLWVAPSTAFRDAVGTDRVREYIYPWFEQNWSLFAPTPRRGEVMFEVRASVLDADTGEEQETDWVMLTDIEDALVRGNLTPPRTMKLTRRTADDLHAARRDMDSEQLDLLEANFIDTPVEELRTMLLEAYEGNVGAVDRYMRADATATFIANAYAQITWGDQGDITRVQYRTSSRRVPDYDPDSDLTLDDVEPSVRDYGWRPSVDIAEEELDLFSLYAETEVD